MDRENIWARGWSHVLSTTNDIAELREFCRLVGAPSSALHLGNRRWPHLDLKLEPRDLALASPGVRVFERTSEMLRFLQQLGTSNNAMRDINCGGRTFNLPGHTPDDPAFPP